MEYYCNNCTKNVKVINAPAGGGRHCRECGSRIVEDSIAPGSMIAGFKIIHEIARDPNGIVYLARQANLERDVALKILPEDKAADSEFIEYFFHEARAAAKLNHPALVQAYDAGVTTDGIYYFAMELIDGETAEALLEQNGAFPPEQVINVALAIAEALEYAWERQQLTHGDIKPANIVFNRHGGAKLADLGLAKIAYDRSNETEIMATPLYAAPELIRGEKDRIGVKTDIYAFGTMLYQMFCGAPPFDEDDATKVMEMHLQAHHVPLKERGNEFHYLNVISDFIDRMIDKEPERRPESWSEIVGFLKTIKSNRHLYEAPVRPKGFFNLIRHYRHVVIPVVLVLIVVVAGLIILWQKRGSYVKPGSVSTVKTRQLPPNIEEKWSNLKNSLQYIRPAEAVIAISDFIKANAADVPSEAEELLRQYRNQSEDIATRAAAARAARLAVTSEIRQIEQGLNEIKHYRDSQFKTRDMFFRIDTLLNQYRAGELPENILAPAAAKRFSEGHSALAARLDIISSSAAEERVASLVAASSRYKPLAPPSRAILAVNAEYNQYFEMINEFIELPESKRTNQFFQKIFENGTGKIRVPELKQRIMFLRATLPDENSVAQLLPRYANEIIGKTLPWSLDGKTFVVTICDVNGLTLQHQISDGVAERKKLPWNKISLSCQSELLREWIVNNSSAKIASDDFYIFAGMMLAQDDKQGMKKLFSRFPDGITGVDLKQWSSCFADFCAAPSESSSWTVVKKILDFEQKDEISAAYREYLYSFSKLKNTGNWRRYHAYFDAIFEPYLRSQPEAIAEQAASVFNPAPDAAQMAEVLNRACAAREIYGNLKSVPLPLRDNLNKQRRIILERWAVSATDKKCKDWLRPGVMWLATHDIKRNDDVMAQIATAMNIGDMAVVNACLKNKIASDSLSSYPAEWHLPSLYYAAWAGAYFENSSIRDEAMTALRRLSAKKDINAFCWALQAALQCRQNPAAASLQRDYPASYPAGPSDLRASLLCLIVEMQRESCYGAGFATMVTRYRDRLKNRLGEVEKKWLEVITDIVCDHNEVNSKLRSLSGSVPAEPELFALLMTDAVARRAMMSEDISIATAVKIVQNLGGSDRPELWYRLALLHLVETTATAAAIESKTEFLIRDLRIAAVPYYPRLAMINIAAGLLNKSLSLPDIQFIIRRFMDSVPMRTASDNIMLNLVSSPKALEQFQEAMVKFEMNESFLFGGCLTAAVVTAGKNHSAAAIIVTQLKQSPNLLWQERLFLRAWSDLIDATAKLDSPAKTQ